MTMSSSLDMARDASSQQSSQDMQARLQGLQRSSLSPQAKEKKLREACEGFESIFIQNMWKEMRKTVNQTSFLHGKEEQFWQDMYDQELAKKMTEAGGIGLANMMYAQLSSHLTSASRTTAMMANPRPNFVPSAAPLLKEEVTPAGFEEQAKLNLHEPSTIYEELSAKRSLPEEPKNEVAAEVKAPQKQEVKIVKKDDGVDPSIESALAAMRANTRASRGVSENLAEINYFVPMGRQQPAATGLDMVKAVRRQAGDQLGSRGVREPLMPQTESARNATAQADMRREARQRERAEARQEARMNEQAMQPNPQNEAIFAPMTNVPNQDVSSPKQAEAPREAQSEQIRKVTYITNRPQSSSQKRNENAIKTLKIEEKRAASTGQNQTQSQVQVQSPETLRAPENLAAIAQRQNSDKKPAYTIPPLTVQDLQI